MNKESHNLRLLFLYDILYRQTDEAHAYSAIELCEMLSLYGIECERKTIYRDIDDLHQYGLDIVNSRTPVRGYYLKNRKLTVEEARLLIDAVQAAKFISVKNTKSLIYKIGSLLSEFQEEELREQIYVDNRLKTNKDDIYSIIKTLDDGIKNSKQVVIKYNRKKLANKFLNQNEIKSFTVNPYALLWSNDHYYLICNNDKYNNLMHLRLDRIDGINLTNRPSKHFSKVSNYKDKFDIADYSNKLFNMYSGETGQIKLNCSLSIIDDIYEKFGDEISVKTDGSDRFTFKASIEMSNGLVSWIMQYGSDIKVLSPKKLSDAVKEKASEIFRIYE